MCKLQEAADTTHSSARGLMGCLCLQATTQALRSSAPLPLPSVSCLAALLRSLQL